MEKEDQKFLTVPRNRTLYTYTAERFPDTGSVPSRNGKQDQDLNTHEVGAEIVAEFSTFSAFIFLASRVGVVFCNFDHWNLIFSLYLRNAIETQQR